jgi:hypothetical protein
MFKNLSWIPTLKLKDQNAPQGVEMGMYCEKKKVCYEKKNMH